MLKTIFPIDIYQKIITVSSLQDIAEVRLKRDDEIQIYTVYGQLYRIGAIATDTLIASIINLATEFSRYAFEEEIQSGYLAFSKGYRIGLGGNFIDKGGKIELKQCNSLVIRVPHEIFRASFPLNALFAERKNIIIISPPGGGKTTMLRDAARELSKKYKTLVIDERYEIGGLQSELNVGRADIVSGVRKGNVLEGVIRAMSPEIVLLDELYGREEFALAEDLSASGISIIATLHADNIANAEKRFSRIREVFAYAVTLTSKPRAGSIQSIERL